MLISWRNYSTKCFRQNSVEIKLQKKGESHTDSAIYIQTYRCLLYIHIHVSVIIQIHMIQIQTYIIRSVSENNFFQLL